MSQTPKNHGTTKLSVVYCKSKTDHLVACSFLVGRRSQTKILLPDAAKLELEFELIVCKSCISRFCCTWRLDIPAATTDISNCIQTPNIPRKRLMCRSGHLDLVASPMCLQFP